MLEFGVLIFHGFPPYSNVHGTQPRFLLTAHFFSLPVLVPPHMSCSQPNPPGTMSTSHTSGQFVDKRPKRVLQTQTTQDRTGKNPTQKLGCAWDPEKGNFWVPGGWWNTPLASGRGFLLPLRSSQLKRDRIDLPNKVSRCRSPRSKDNSNHTHGVAVWNKWENVCWGHKPRIDVGQCS